MEYIIGTRGSKLALVQAEYVCERLREAYPQDSFSIQIIKTKGDLIQDRPLDQIGAKGLFVKEIEEQILSGEVHIGVHSMKDMPAIPAEGLVFTKAWKREDPRDVLILREKKSLAELPAGAVIGTGSKRRAFQLLSLRPDLKTVDIRGNVDTRLRKMTEQGLDGIVLAAAGLKRLSMDQVISQYLEPEEMIPAPAQGILALEIRAGEEKLLEMLDALSDEKSTEMAKAERGFLAEMGADCHVPVGAVCRCVETMDNRKADGSGLQKLYQLDAMFGDSAGKKVAYTSQLGTDTEILAKEAACEIRKQLAGKVILVGAGPGDPGLITVKGLQAIREADCIIYDRLASPELLQEAKPDCECIYVGKANHNHTMKQEDINQLLVDMAMKYEKTVRLKGGDVYVFGRGGEEGLYLRERGVSFEVVPGISSSMAGLAYAGIPITHRGVATGFHVVTAHNKRDELADIDFKAMAAGKDTCVFLMGLSKLGEIAEKLIEAGMSSDTPAAVISHATTAEQKTCTAALNHIAEEVVQAGITSPALIVVGQVVKLRESLNFFETKPLFGKSYLVPRVGEKTSEITEGLQELGAHVDEIQVGSIRYLSFVEGADLDKAHLDKAHLDKTHLDQVNWLLFTSKHGVRSIFENLDRAELDIRALSHVKIAAIGEKTAEVLKTYGIHADLMPKAYHSAALLDVLKKKLKPENVVWYPQVTPADGQYKTALSGYCQLVEIPAYENIEAAWKLPEGKSLESYDGICFSCGSSVKRLLEGMPVEMVERMSEGMPEGIPCYSIGPKTTETLKEWKIEHIYQAANATCQSVVECVLEHCNGKEQCHG
ncbi:MAG: hydroxymethylbilane synthase [Lachnospiraceae bacterium]|nr:hydroxymethylbilane synthase [Lachnospiraceae bacterium]